MFWIAWLGAYYFLAVILVVLTRVRRIWPYAWAALPAFVLGSAPFWVYNLAIDPGATLRSSLPVTAESTAPLVLLAEHSLIYLVPRLVTGSSVWWPSGRHLEGVMIVLYFSALLVLVASPFFRSQCQTGCRPLRLMLSVFIPGVPLLYLLSAYSRNALTLPTLDTTGRYVVMLHSVLPIGIAAAAAYLARSRARWIGAALAGSVLALNLALNVTLNPLAAFDSPYYSALPGSLDPLIAYLDAQEVHYVWTEIGLGRVLMFETGQRILAADYYDAYIAGGKVRFPDVLAAVEAAPRTAFVVTVQPDQEVPPLQRVMDGANVRYTRVRPLPTVMVFIPEERIDPALISGGLGPQTLP